MDSRQDTESSFDFYPNDLDSYSSESDTSDDPDNDHEEWKDKPIVLKESQHVGQSDRSVTHEDRQDRKPPNHDSLIDSDVSSDSDEWYSCSSGTEMDTGEDKVKQTPSKKSLHKDRRIATSAPEVTKGTDESFGNSLLKNVKLTTSSMMCDFSPSKFVVTAATREAMRIIERHGVVTVTGQSGSGKTQIALYLLTELSKNGCVPLILNDAFQWDLIPHNKRYVILIDDILGKTNLSSVLKDLWSQKFRAMHSRISSGNICLIMTSRSNIYANCSDSLEVEVELFGRGKHISLCDDKHKLSADEKENIMFSILRSSLGCTVNVSKADIKRVAAQCEIGIGFPQCCAFYASCEAAQKRKMKYFEKPLEFLNSQLKVMQRTDPLAYLALLILMFKNGTVQTSLLNPNEKDAEVANIIRNCSETLDIQGRVTLGNIHDKLDMMIGVYVTYRKATASFHFSHQSIADAVFIKFCKRYIETGLQLCTLEQLNEYVRSEVDSTNESLFVHVEHASFEFLAKRLTEEMLNGNMNSILCHPSFEDFIFVKYLLHESWHKKTVLQILSFNNGRRFIRTKLIFSKSMQYYIARNVQKGEYSFSLEPTDLYFEYDNFICHLIMKGLDCLAMGLIGKAKILLNKTKYNVLMRKALECSVFLGNEDLIAFCVDNDDSFVTEKCLELSCYSLLENSQITKSIHNIMNPKLLTLDTLDTLLRLCLQKGKLETASFLITATAKFHGRWRVLHWAVTQILLQHHLPFLQFTEEQFKVDIISSDKAMFFPILSRLLQEISDCFEEDNEKPLWRPEIIALLLSSGCYAAWDRIFKLWFSDSLYIGMILVSDIYEVTDGLKQLETFVLQYLKDVEHANQVNTNVFCLSVETLLQYVLETNPAITNLYELQLPLTVANNMSTKEYLLEKRVNDSRLELFAIRIADSVNPIASMVNTNNLSVSIVKFLLILFLSLAASLSVRLVDTWFGSQSRHGIFNPDTDSKP
ncbi:uncharacterized protein LOC121367235 [Gigantopelta aegis]|uniref:uncharacterized protein LOC121367235 n=1 Tax=Gigantopelta aegis TaxID=1735272 RepID=UPI001B88AEFF|nr:uncharacterized protein LOC121367235 [Gigantopelta aegis]